MSDPFNFLAIVVDSCRWDTFNIAATKNIDTHFDVVCAGAMSTFTYPAHMAMFQGFFPDSVSGRRPIYNRFAMAVYHWHYRSKGRPCLSVIQGGQSIPRAMHNKGHRTVAVGGVSWFSKHTPMRLGFEHFKKEPDAEVATDTFLKFLDKEPFYGLLNFGATHRPYNVPGLSPELKKVKSPGSNNLCNSTFNPRLRDKQAACLTHVDGVLDKLFDRLQSNKLRTVACFCADHGDCMGEDNCYGHGFYHPSVMFVPLGWTVFMPGGKSYPITEENLKLCGFSW